MAHLLTVLLIAIVGLAENAISRKNVSMESPHSNFVEEYPDARTTPKMDHSRLQSPSAQGKVPGYPKSVPVELKNPSLRTGKKALKGGVLSAASDPSNSSQPLRRYLEPDDSELNGSNQMSEIIDDITKRPYMASVRMKDTHVCGGALIGALWVLTAAMCVQFDAEDMSVLAGTPHIYKVPVEDGMMQLRLVEMAISHDKFVEPYKVNNIAIIKVRRPFVLTRWVNVLSIPWVSVLNPNAVCTTCNWVSLGNTRYEHLICQPITFMSQHTCALQPFLASTISSTLLCSLARVADVRISQISSGGPVVCQDKAVGILFHNNVLDYNVHRFFTRIDQFLVFITKHIPDIRPPPPTVSGSANDLISTLLKGFKLRLNVTLTGKFCLPDEA